MTLIDLIRLSKHCIFLKPLRLPIERTEGQIYGMSMRIRNTNNGKGNAEYTPV